MHFVQLFAFAAAAGIAYGNSSSSTKCTTTTSKTITSTWQTSTSTAKTSTSTAKITSTSSYACRTYTDTYDSFATSAPIGNYNGLNYVYWTADQGDVSNTGVVPPTSPNVAKFTLINDNTMQSSLLNPIVYDNPVGEITLAPGSQSAGFYSFYYGCFDETDMGAVEHVTSDCEFNVFGYDIWGNPLSSFAVNYGIVPAGTLPTLAQMSYVVFPIEYWGNVKNVTFVASGSGTLGVPADLAVIIDSLVHSINCIYLP